MTRTTNPNPLRRFSEKLFFVTVYSAALAFLCGIVVFLSEHFFGGAFLILLALATVFVGSQPSVLETRVDGE
jgi:hypothetical protein